MRLSALRVAKKRNMPVVELRMSFEFLIYAVWVRMAMDWRRWVVMEEWFQPVDSR
jgi:hypothetical protein